MKPLNFGTGAVAPITAVSFIEAFGDVKDFPSWLNTVVQAHQTFRDLIFWPFKAVGLRISDWQSDLLYFTFVIFVAYFFAFKDARVAVRSSKNFIAADEKDEYVKARLPDNSSTHVRIFGNLGVIIILILFFLSSTAIAQFSEMNRNGIELLSSTSIHNLIVSLLIAIFVNALILNIAASILATFWFSKDIYVSATVLRHYRRYWDEQCRKSGKDPLNSNEIKKIWGNIREHKARFKIWKKFPTYFAYRIGFLVIFTFSVYASISLIMT